MYIPLLTAMDEAEERDAPEEVRLILRELLEALQTWDARIEYTTVPLELLAFLAVIGPSYGIYVTMLPVPAAADDYSRLGQLNSLIQSYTRLVKNSESAVVTWGQSSRLIPLLEQCAATIGMSELKHTEPEIISLLLDAVVSPGPPIRVDAESGVPLAVLS